MTETLVTLWLVTLTLGSVFVFGLPLAGIVVRGEDRDDLLWILAPFLGLSTIVLVAQNLVYCDIPVARSAPWLWLLAALFFVSWRSKRRIAVASPPRSPLLAAFIACGVHGYGLFALGAAAYVAYGYIDHFNYTATAQFLLDHPFRTGFTDVDHTPYLAAAVRKKHERIGEAVLQAFLAASGFTNAKTAYGPASLLSPFLTALAAWAVARRAGLSGWPRSAAALAAALVPGFAMIHLECYYSQALAVPILLVWPLLVERILLRPSWHAIATAGIVFAAANAIYTEFTPVFVVLALGPWAWRMIVGPGRLGRSVALLAGLAGAVVLNPWFAADTWATVNQTAVPWILSHTYPFAMTTEGVRRLWFGDTCAPSWLCAAASRSGLLLTGLGAIGWAWVFLRSRSLPSVSWLALMAFPGALLLLGRYPYQFYKLFMTVSPVLVLGVWILAAGDAARTRGRAIRQGALVLLAIVAAISASGTVRLVGRALRGWERSATHYLNTPAQRARYAELEATRGRALFLASAHPMDLAWLAYHARKSRAWLMAPAIADVPLVILPPMPFLRPADIPPGVEIVQGWQYPQGQARAGVAVYVDSPEFRGVEGDESHPLKDPMRLLAFSPGEDASFRLSFAAIPLAPLLARGQTLRVSRDRTVFCETPLTGPAQISCLVKLPHGYSVTLLAQTEGEGAAATMDGDASSVVRIQKMRIDRATVASPAGTAPTTVKRPP